MNNATDREELSKAGRVIAETIAEAISLSSSDVLKKFAELETSLLQQGFDKSESLEIKRRIAEAKISILAKRKENIDHFEVAWNDIESLGYSSLEREASMLYYCARFLIENEPSRSSAAVIIDRLGALVKKFEVDQSQSLADHFLKLHEELLDDLNSKYQ